MYAGPYLKLYYRIHEVASMLSIPPYTLRFWESEFKELKPMRTAKGTRRYTPADIEIIKKIQYLLHIKGLRIEAVKIILREEGQ